MGFSYILKLGYRHGQTSDISQDEEWDILKRLTLSVCTDGETLLREARDNTNVAKFEGLYEIEEYVDALQTNAAPPQIREDDKYISFPVSGSNPLRCIVVRTVCRLVIKHMHSLGLDVDLETV